MDSNQDFGSILNNHLTLGQADRPPREPAGPAPSVDEFVKSVMPAAQKAAQKLNVPVEAVIGQWGLETGWGKSVIPGTNNLGNIKGRGVAATDNMTGSRDEYRQYGSVDEFADDFTNLVGNGRYKAVPGSRDAQGYFQNLKAAGYAEDPDYVAKGGQAAAMAADALKRAGVSAPTKADQLPDLTDIPKWGQIAAGKKYNALPDAEKKSLKAKYFDEVIAPYAKADGADVAAERARFLSEKQGMLDQAWDATKGFFNGKESVLEGAPPAPELATTSKVPVRKDVRAAFNAAWDSATPEQRAQMQGQEGWTGMLARERAGVFERQDGVATPTTQKFDPRIEARRNRLVGAGEDPAFAQRAAMEGASRGVVPGRELEALDGTVQKSEFDFDTKAMFDTQGDRNGLNNPLGRGVTKAVLGTGKAAAGYMEFLGDLTGLKDGADGMREFGKGIRGQEEAIGESGGMLERNLEGAISSIGQQLPLMIAGVGVGSQVLPLAGMALQSFGQEYSDGKARGQSLEQAAARAGLFAAFEVIGEKFGLGAQMEALKGAAKGMPSDQIIGLLWSALKKEVPGEILTTTGQFSVDKFAPGGIGLNPNATFADYVQQLGDTITQTVMQAGLMGAGTTGVSTAVRYMKDRGPLEGVANADAELARQQALNKWNNNGLAPRVEPTMGAEPLAVTPDGRIEPTGTPEAQSADAIVAELAQQAGIPTETVLPTPTPPVNTLGDQPAPSADDDQTTDQDVIDFAAARYQQLREKQNGSIQTVVGEDGMSDQDVPGVGLSPAERQELAGLERANQDPAALRAMYGMGTTQESELDTEARLEREAIQGEQALAADPVADDTDIPFDAPAQPVGTTGEGAGVSQPTQEQPIQEAAPAPAEPVAEQKPAEPPKPRTEKEAKQQKALDRIAKGTAYFGSESKAQAWVKDNNLTDTHTVERDASGANKWNIVAKKEAPSAQAPEAKQAETQREEAPAAAAKPVKFDIDRAWRDLIMKNKFSDHDTPSEISVTRHDDHISGTGQTYSPPTDFVLGVQSGKDWVSLSVQEYDDPVADGAKVLSSSLEASADYPMGTGIGTKLYLAALNVAQKSNRGWQSEGIRSGNSQAIYERLKNAGIPFVSAGNSSYISAADLKGVDLGAVADKLANAPKTEKEAKAKKASTAVAPVAKAGGDLKANMPNVVVRDVRGFNGEKLGDIIEQHDGTREGILAAAERTHVRLQDEFYRASNAASRIGATDENGNPAWVVSPNGRIAPIDSRDGAYIWGDLSAAPKQAEKADVVEDVSKKPAETNTSAEPVQKTDLNAMFDDVLAEEVAKDEAKKPRTEKEAKAQRSNNGPHYAAGMSAFSEGKPRVLPSYFTKPGDKNSKDWYRGWDAANAAAPTTERQAKANRSAAAAAASAASNSAKALSNAIDGLGALFGQTPTNDGITKLNSGIPVEINAETYAKAKPLFQAAVANLGDAGKDIKEAMRAVVRMVMDKFGAQAAQNMKPYVVRYVEEISTAKPEVEVSATDLYTPEGKFKVASEIADFLIGDGSFKTIIEARKKISEIIGRPIEAATELAKQADEAIEVGVVLAGRMIVDSGRRRGLTPDRIYKQLVDLYNRQPNLAVRSSTSVRDQAYSTPVPLAYVASELAGVTYDTKLLESTAGNGMLTIGASLKNAIVNELNPKRAAMLRAIGFNPTERNAATEKLRHAGYPVDAVVINPPFGATKDASGNTIIYEVKPNFSTREVDHAIVFKSLEAMKDDGRAVLIVGGVQAENDEARREDYRGKNKRTFYFNLYNDYKVVDHFSIDGDMYSKQGASYPVDVIVIEGRGKSTRDLPAASLPNIIKSYDELKEKLNGNRSVGTQGDVGTAGTDSGQNQTGRNDGTPVAGSPVGSGDGAGGTGGATGNSTGVRGTEQASDGQPAGSRTGTGTGQPGSQNIPEPGAVGTDKVSGNRGGEKSRSTPGNRGNGSPELGGTSVVAGERVESGLTDRRGEEQETETQVAYKPHSQAASVGTLVPKAMRDAIDNSIQKIEDEVGSIDEYVAGALALDPETVRGNFSAEQIDALALSIRNAEAGRGFIIGDQTGIGKGRVVAAMIRYAIVNGKTPIFVTEKPNLYSDMIRDLDDIGMTDDLALDTKQPRIFITNGSESIPYTLLRTVDGEPVETNLVLKAPKSGKALDQIMKEMADSENLGQYKVIFTTYSQLQTVKGKMTERMRFIKAFGSDNYMIFDESHNAGGAGDTQARSKEQKEAEKNGESLTTGRAAFVRQMVNSAFGTFFSSATYAKRPDVMDLYSSTNMKLAVDKISQLGEAIKNGGVPMQQVVANMLTSDGQYIRRERTFAGVSYDTKETKVDQKTAENMASAMRSILGFSRAKEAVVGAIQKEMDKQGAIASATGEGTSVQGANFGSIMHNLIDQMLLSLKAQDSVKHAIERLKAGEKVVMTVSNTMGSFLQSYAEEMGLNTGDVVSLSFSDLYNRYLEKQRVITIKDSVGNKTKRRLTDQELGPELTARFEAIRKQIAESGFGSAPISPIDYLHAELRKAGYKTDEITGRTITLDYSNGKPVLASRGATIKQRVNAVRGFNNGDTDVLILNQAGSTGLSLHAAAKFKDKRKRHMIIVQAEKNIDTHMQMLGRVHRTGQVIAPAYSQMMADIPAEMRPAAVLLKKMASLNANTTASRKSSVTAEGVVDFMNDYGGQVALEYLRDNADVHMAIGGSKVVGLKDNTDEATEDDIRKLTGYIPILPIKKQEEIYKDLIDRYNELVERENSMGTNKLEAKAVDLDAQTLSSVQITEDKGDPSIFASSANMEQVDVKRMVKPYSSAEVNAMIAEALGGKTAVQFANETKAALREKAVKFAKDDVDAMMKDGADQMDIDSRKLALNYTYDRAASVLDNFLIGDAVSIKDQNSVFLYGVITGLSSSGRTANPAAGSAWKMQIALANGESKTLNINFSQIGSKYMLSRESVIDWFNADTQKSERVPVLKIFDMGATARREKRWVVTGNILAGFAKYPGQIISYTKKDGTTSQGVMMNRQFDYEKEQKNQPVRLKSGVDAVKFLQSAEGVTIGTPDGVLKIAHRYGKFITTVPSSKREGGTYYLDQELTSALKGDFYKRGSVMSATNYYADAVVKAVDYLINSREETIVATTHTDKAKEMFGPKQATKNDSLNTTTGSALPRFKQKYGNEPVDLAEALNAAELITGMGFDTKIAYADSAIDKYTPMRVNFKTRVIEVNPDYKMSQAEAVQYLIEELLHRVDLIGGGARSISAGSNRLDPSTGDIGKEAMEAFLGDKEGLSKFLMYPLDHRLGYDLPTVKAELFARLGVLYFADPTTFKRVLPNAYDFYSKLVPVAVSGNTHVLRKVWGQPSGSSLEVRGGQRPVRSGQQGHAGGAGQEQASRGLESLRGAIGRGLSAPAGGTVFKSYEDGLNTRDTGDDATPSTIARRIQNNAIQFFGNRDKTPGLKTFGAYDKTLATQFHKALKDKHYGKVFAYVNAMQNEVSLTSIRPAELAPGVLPRVDDVKSAAKQLFKGKKADKNLEVAATAIFAGTLYGDNVLGGKVFTEAEFMAMPGATPTGYALYRQARDAIDASLDEVAAAEAYAMAQGFVPKGMRRSIIDNPMQAESLVMGEIDRQIKTLAKAIKAAKRMESDQQAAELEAARNGYLTTRRSVEKIFITAKNLKAAGYAPLMRFGKFTVTVQAIDPETGNIARNEDGESITEFYGQYETEGEAKSVRAMMEQRYGNDPGYRVTAGTKSQTSHELYAGISPETLALFAEAIGADQTMRKHIELAMSERSALKRRLERKGTAGYSSDMPRVLSNFITSNGRHAAQRYYLRDLNNAIKYIPKEKGDVLDEAMRLKKFVMNPSDPAAPVSSIMFAWFLGGSVASAMVNLSQPVMMTGPYLSQFGIKAATQAMAEALPYALGKKEITDAGMRDALKRASQEGIVDAQEIFHLYSVGAQGVASGLVNTLSRLPGVGGKIKAGSEDARARINAFLTLWGSMFSLAESFNRKLTFIAAYKVAQANGEKNAYQFAVRAVNETQGIYNKVNRPNWAQGPVGRTVLTFKQFSIMYVELLSRMVKKGGPEGKRAALIMLATLMLAAGEEGLPFAQDLDDLIDTLGQLLGYDTNMKRWKRRHAHEIMGKELGDLFLYGISSQLPLDFAGRLGMGNLIPGTGLLKPSTDQGQVREVTEVFGPAAGLIGQIADAYDAAVEGNTGKALQNLAPTAVKNALAGAEMAAKGYATDTKGRKVIEVDGVDAAFKSIGFQPTQVARETRKTTPVYQDLALQKRVETSIVAQWAQAVAEGDNKAAQKQQQRLTDWNRDNPDTPIRITPDQIRSKARQMATDKDARLLKLAPREMRGRLGLDLAD